MNKQIIISFLLIVAAGVTLFLYTWTAKKQINYRGDERWQLIQNKANNVIKYSIYILIVILIIGDAVSSFFHTQMTFTFGEVSTYFLLFFGLRNAIELFALKYFDKRM